MTRIVRTRRGETVVEGDPVSIRKTTGRAAGVSRASAGTMTDVPQKRQRTVAPAFLGISTGAPQFGQLTA
jgi:hypothetical protein